jgi:hypothetical protein
VVAVLATAARLPVNEKLALLADDDVIGRARRLQEALHRLGPDAPRAQEWSRN